MLHTIARTIRRYYLGVVFAGYLLAFGLAFVMVFALPIGALGMVFLALMALIPIVCIWMILCAVERRLALAKLRRGCCPVCSGNSARACEVSEGVSFRCETCRGNFSARGEEIVPD